MAIHSILDIGTNSIKFFVTEVIDGEVKTLVDTNNISRLGEGLQNTGKISDEAMKRNIRALAEFLEKSKKLQADSVIAVGTMCLRTASNAADFIKRAKKELGLEIQVIDGKEEARLSYLAVLSTLDNLDRDVVVFDTGGGSTEFIFGKGKELLDRISLNIGAVQPTEKFLHSDPIKPEELTDMLCYISEFFQKHNLSGKADYLIGIGGTVTTMGAVKHKMTVYDPTIIQGSPLSLAEVERQLVLYSGKTVADRKEIPGLQPKRADVIIAGAGIVKTIMETFDLTSFTISDRGLRHGLLFDKYLTK